MISNNDNYYQNIVNKLKSSKIILSDAKYYAKNLEKAYQKSIENYVNHLPHENIFID
jgi:hypothetical protein